MEETVNYAGIANCTVHYLNHTESGSDIEWREHPKFKGVHLKNLIVGEKTNHQFSSHLVKIDPNCSLDTHCHTEQWELHEIIEGQGVCQFANDKLEYHFGKMAVIPSGVNHQIQAGENGLVLLAKFFPPLL